MINNSQADSNLGGWDAKSVFGGSDQEAHDVGKNEAIKALGAMKISEEPVQEMKKSGISSTNNLKVDYNTGRDEVAGVWGEISMDSLAPNEIPNNNNNTSPVINTNEPVKENKEEKENISQRSDYQVEIVVPATAPQVKAHPMPKFNKPIPVVPYVEPETVSVVNEPVATVDPFIQTETSNILKDSIEMDYQKDDNIVASSVDSLAPATNTATAIDIPLQKTGFLNTAVRDMAKGALEAAGVYPYPNSNMNPNNNNNNKNNNNEIQELKPTPPDRSPSEAHSNRRSGRGNMSKFLTGDGGDIVLRNRRQGNDNNGNDDINVQDSLEVSAPITRLQSEMDEETEEHEAAAIVQRHFRGLQGRKEAARVELEQARNRLREKEYRRADATVKFNDTSTNGRVKTKRLPRLPQEEEQLQSHDIRDQSPPVMKAVRRPPINPRNMSTMEMNKMHGYRRHQHHQYEHDEEDINIEEDSIMSNKSKGRTSRLRKPKGGPDSAANEMNGLIPFPPADVAVSTDEYAEETEPESYEYGHEDALDDHRSASDTHVHTSAIARVDENENENWDEDSLIELDDETAAAALRGSGMSPEREKHHQIKPLAHSHAQNNHDPSRYLSSIAMDPDWGDDIDEGDNDLKQAYPVGSPARLGLTDNYDPFVVATNRLSHSGNHDNVKNSPIATPGVGIGSPIRLQNQKASDKKAPGVAQLLAAASEAMTNPISPSKLRTGAPTMWQPPVLGNKENLREEEMNIEKRNALANAEKELEEKRQELVAREEFLAQQQMALQQQQQEDRRQMVRMQEEMQAKHQQQQQQQPQYNPHAQNKWDNREQSPMRHQQQQHYQQQQQQYTNSHPPRNEAIVRGRPLKKGGYQQQHAKKQEFVSHQAAPRHHQQQPQRYRQEDVSPRNERGGGERGRQDRGREREGRGQGMEGYAGDYQEEEVEDHYDPYHEEEMQFEREAQQQQQQQQQQRGRGIGRGSNKQCGPSKSRSRSPRARNGRNGRDNSGSPSRQAPIHPGGVVEQYRERRKIKKQVMDDSEEQALMREIAELDEQQKHLEESPKRIKVHADRLALQKERKENKDKNDADKKKRAKLAFGPGARDYRSDKDPLKARREKAQQDRLAARERRERKALGDANGNNGNGNVGNKGRGNGRRDYGGGAENEPPNMKGKRGVNRVSENAEPESISHWDNEPSEYGYDQIPEEDGGYLRGFESKAPKPNQRRGRRGAAGGKGYDDGDARSEEGYSNKNNRGRKHIEETSSLPPLKQRHSRKPNSAGTHGNQRLPPIEPQYAY